MLDAHPLQRPRLSDRAEDALDFLEQHGRMQTDAIGANIHRLPPKTDRSVSLPDSAQASVRHRRSSADSQIASLFLFAPECREPAGLECPQSRRFAAKSKNTAPSKGRVVAESAEQAAGVRIVSLVRKVKSNASLPLRAALHYSPAHRKAV
jgi:hypothetical protein